MYLLEPISFCQDPIRSTHFNHLFHILPILLYISYAIYTLNLLSKLRLNWVTDLVNNAETDPIPIAEKCTLFIDKTPSITELEKYADIFRKIEEYYIEKEPYLNQNFRLTDLAYDLDINLHYITTAIKQQTGSNFNVYTNQYRIEKAKELMTKYPKKYTMRHISLVAGFVSISTFNRAFRQQEGVNPSEFLEMQ